MSLSVILPNYNHAHWLARALLALARQDPPPSEIIVVDDASTDNSLAVIEDLQAQFGFIRLLRHETNKGAEAAVKTALQIANGEFLMFAAADDFVLPGLFRTGMAALRDHPPAAFFCSEVALIDNDDRVIGFRPITIPSTSAGYISPSQVRAVIRKSDNWFLGSSVIYRHDRLAEIGYFDHTLGTLQDALATRLLAFRWGFYFIPKVLSTWRIVSGSLSVQSSLSNENAMLPQRATQWISEHFPTDIREEYGRLFDKRLRFNIARAHLVWRETKLNTQTIGDILKWGRRDRAILQLLTGIPFLSSPLVLAWMTLRVRPYAMVAMIASLWRSLTTNQIRRSSFERMLSHHKGNPRVR